MRTGRHIVVDVERTTRRRHGKGKVWIPSGRREHREHENDWVGRTSEFE